MCTVYGILLNYPFIYWFDTDINRESCISSVPLVVNKVYIPCILFKDKASFTYEIMSFSYPQYLHLYLMNAIAN